MATLGFVALDVLWMDISTNARNISKLLHRESNLGTLDAIFFPETSLTGFACLESPLAVTGVETSLRWLHAKAQEGGVRSFIGGFINTEGKVHNSVIEMGSSVTEPHILYSKQNLFEWAGENVLCSPGQDLGLISLKELRIGVLICFDLRSMRSFQELVKSGVDVIVVLANWPELRHAHFISLLQVRAMDFGLPVIGLNRSGRDPVAGTYIGGAFGYFQNGEEMDFESDGEIFVTDLTQELIASKAPAFRAGLRI